MKVHSAPLLVVIPFLFLCGIARGTVIHYSALLDGPSEFPANASPGTGTADVYYDDTAHTMRVVVSFSGLIGTVTAAHIHGGTAVANIGTAAVATTTPTFSGFPGGVTFGAYDSTFDMMQASSYRGGFITSNGGTTASAEAALFTFMSQERTYLNIHTNVFPGGEIRGFLHNAPDGGDTVLLLGGAMFGLALLRRRFGR